MFTGNSEMFIEAFTLTLPLNYIPGSEKAKAVMLGMSFSAISFVPYGFIHF